MPDNLLKKHLLKFLDFFLPVMIHLQSSHHCSVLNLSGLSTTNTIPFLSHMGTKKSHVVYGSRTPERPVRRTLCWEYITEPSDKDGEYSEVFSTTLIHKPSFL